jgi:predicted nucleic acid-binding protein
MTVTREREGLHRHEPVRDADDRRDRDKQRAAIDVVGRAIRASSGAISAQVLMEYAAVALSKLRQERAAVVRQPQSMARLAVLSVEGGFVRSALELMAAYTLSFWNATIVAAAQAAHCDVLISEDLSHGMGFGAVSVRSPFVPAWSARGGCPSVSQCPPPPPCRGVRSTLGCRASQAVMLAGHEVLSLFSPAGPHTSGSPKR